MTYNKLKELVGSMLVGILSMKIKFRIYYRKWYVTAIRRS